MSKIQILQKVGHRSSTGKSRWSQKSRTEHFGQLETAEVFQRECGGGSRGCHSDSDHESPGVILKHEW